MTELDALRGVALLQRGAEDLVAVARGTTGTSPDTDCSLATRFQIASVTKQFTAAAVLLLADRGLLSVNDPISRWLDNCPVAWDPITVHHLLSNSAGLVHWPGLAELDVTRPVATSEKLRAFAAAPLLSPPGERYSYSSPGYVLLAHILERATGLPYGAFLAQEIFEPLNMAATFNGMPSGQPSLAVGCQDGAAVPSFALNTLGLGTGGIWSTVGDLARWDRALADGEILSEAARRAMRTVHVPSRMTTALSTPRATATAGSSAPPLGTGSLTTPATTLAFARSMPGSPMTACAWRCSAMKALPASTRSSMT